MKMDLAQLTTKTNLKMLFEEKNALLSSPRQWRRVGLGQCHAMEKQVFVRAKSRVISAGSRHGN
jgi:hypothetical protein